MQQIIRDYVSEQFKQRKQALQFDFPNERCTDLLEIVDGWWNEVDVKKAKEISMRDFCKLIITKGVVSKAFEVIKMIKSTIRIKIPADGMIKHSQYQQIFVRVYMRSVLMNIYYYLRKMTERDNEDDQMELAKKINGTEIGSEIKNGLLYVLKYQRKLVLGGIRQQQKNLGVDRQELLRNIQYQSDISKPVEEESVEEEEAALPGGAREFLKSQTIQGTEDSDENDGHPHPQAHVEVDTNESLVLKEVNKIRMFMNKSLKEIKEKYYYKNSFRGVKNRGKLDELREKGEIQRVIAECFLSYKAVVASNPKPFNDAMMFFSKNQTVHLPKSLIEKDNIDFSDQKALYKIGKDLLGLKKKYLKFLDADNFNDFCQNTKTTFSAASNAKN